MSSRPEWTNRAVIASQARTAFKHLPGSPGNSGLGAADGGEASAAPGDVRLPQRASAAAGLR
jgi:hypothetical protein